MSFAGMTFKTLRANDRKYAEDFPNAFTKLRSVPMCAFRQGDYSAFSVTLGSSRPRKFFDRHYSESHDSVQP